MPSRSSSILRFVPKTAAAGDGPRPPGSRRPHRDATVAKVRRLVETTPLTYGEIAEKTGVGRASICRWTRDGGWRRHLFAPRATDTVPRERAGARLRLRTLAARIAALAERYITELENTRGVDLDRLSEAQRLYQIAKLAARTRKPRGTVKYAEPFYASPAAALFAEMRALGVDPTRAPEDAVIDYITSRFYEDPALRPRNRTKRERREAWMRQRE